MAHIYTPGLTVTARTVIRKQRLLPIPGAVLAQAGDLVRAETVVARTELPGNVHAVNVANLLGVAPDEIRDYLTKREGDPIERDEVLAESRPLIKWFKTQARSPVQGRVESVSTVTGQVLLREPPRPLDLLGYIDGVVAEVHPSQGVTIETECGLVQGIFGIGGETWGDLVVAVKSPDETLRSDHLVPAMSGKIVVGGAFVGVETLSRVRELGIKAVVVGGIHDQDLRALLGYDLGVAITGTERVGFTLILTEGFGNIPMAAKTFELLAANAGAKASVSGATQIRAGVIRPEVIIPRRDHLPSPPFPKRESEGVVRAGIQVGDQVRIIREPLFGKIGRVTDLPADPKAIETESRVRVLEVQFADSSRATIPRANVEVIEGQ